MTTIFICIYPILRLCDAAPAAATPTFRAPNLACRVRAHVDEDKYRAEPRAEVDRRRDQAGRRTRTDRLGSVSSDRTAERVPPTTRVHEERRPGRRAPTRPGHRRSYRAVAPEECHVGGPPRRYARLLMPQSRRARVPLGDTTTLTSFRRTPN